MTDDLVERLRRKITDTTAFCGTPQYRNPDGLEAAARIEQLETKLAEVADDYEWLAENVEYCMGWTGFNSDNGPWPVVKEKAAGIRAILKDTQ